MVTFQTKIVKTESTLNWGYHIIVPEEVARQFIDGTNRRVLCHIEQKTTLHSALMGSKDGWFIMLNQKVRDTLDLAEGSTVNIMLEKDPSEYGMEMPEELEVMLNQEEEAFEVFKSLTAGKQRTLIYIVSKVKSTESRIKKALAIIHHMKECNGIIDFKRLNVLIKMYNNQ